MFRRKRRGNVCGSMKSAVPSLWLLVTSTSPVGWAASAVGATPIAASAATCGTMRCMLRAPTGAQPNGAPERRRLVVDGRFDRGVGAALGLRNFSAQCRFVGAMLGRLAAVALGMVLAAAGGPPAGAAAPHGGFVLTHHLAGDLLPDMPPPPELPPRGKTF